MGRDLQVLFDMIQNHKPVLLGPQTSALPINQSPFYFYLLFPFYILTNQSFLSASITLSFIYISLFIFSLYQFRKDKKISTTILVSFFLLSIHPQYILQGRFVWNPSLVTPFLILSILNLYQYLQHNQKDKLIVFAISSACAISLTYSIVPIIIALLLYVIIYNKSQFKTIFTWLCGSILLLNLSILAQIIRKIIITGTLFGPSQINQVGDSFLQKISNFKSYIIASNYPNINNVLFFGLFILIIFSLKSKQKINNYLATIFCLTFLLTIFSPFNLQAHYIFALTTIIFILIGSQYIKLSLIIIVILSIFYLNPILINDYFKPSVRSYSQMDECLKQYCIQNSKPTFVSVNSNMYPYHFGPEFRYLMSINNCKVEAIEKDISKANFMAIVLDTGTFDNKTKYYELDLFGKNKEISRLRCQQNLEIVTLEKI
jgi:hypothetical protein